MRIMDDSATVEEYYAFAERLAAMAQRLQTRGAHVSFVIDGEVSLVADESVTDAAGTVNHRDL